MDNIREEIIEILDKYIFDKNIWNTVPDNPNLIKDLKINSARVMDIIIDIEEKYNIEVDDESLKDIETLDDIVNAVKKLTNR